jgi:nucleoside 2-deoxyribosyltransferase
MRVFLSGGTRGSWQDRVKSEFKNVEFFDPRSLRGQSMSIIAATERSWLDLSDCLFFYFEESNPSGLGSAFEVGYCAAKGIPVLFIDEKRTQHTEWLGVHCHSIFHTLEDGIRALQDLINDSVKKSPSS